MVCNCKITNMYTDMRTDVSTIINATGVEVNKSITDTGAEVKKYITDTCADMRLNVTTTVTRNVTRNVMLMHLFFVLVHGLMLTCMLHNPAMVKDSTCPPCAPCGPVPVCAKCAPVPQHKPCATVQAWQLHITPNISVPKCDICPPPVQCPKYEAPTCDECVPVPTCDVCPPTVQCPKFEAPTHMCVRGRFCL
jgi:hypothetical protein